MQSNIENNKINFISFNDFNFDFTCKGFQYKVGEEYTHDGGMIMTNFEIINLKEASNKDEAVKLSQEHNMTVKDAVINNFDIMINNLIKIKDNISSGKCLENEDWIKAAVPLNVMMNVLMNHWYLEE